MSIMTTPWVPQTPHQRAVLEVLLSIRALNDAMDRMNGGMKDDMDMNATDLAALRMMIVREQRGDSVSPHDIAKHLRISTASTTKLLDRLESAGYIERHPHPRDRRARILTLTAHSRATFFKHVSEHLEQMRRVTEPYTEDELKLIGRYLSDVSQAIDPS